MIIFLFFIFIKKEDCPYLTIKFLSLVALSPIRRRLRDIMEDMIGLVWYNLGDLPPKITDCFKRIFVTLSVANGISI